MLDRIYSVIFGVLMPHDPGHIRVFGTEFSFVFSFLWRLTRPISAGKPPVAGGSSVHLASEEPVSQQDDQCDGGRATAW